MATSTANPLASGVTAELYRAAIGPRGQDYYLRQFTRFDADGKAGISWHWPAYWNTFNWLVYRRMWGRALAYVAALLGVVLLIFGIGKLVLDYSDTTALLLFLALMTTAFVVPGLYANAWFYAHCNEKISAVLRSTAEIKDACEVLSRQASNDRRWQLLALLNAAALALLVAGLRWVGNMDSALSVMAAREDRPLTRSQTGQVSPQGKPPAAATQVPAGAVPGAAPADEPSAASPAASESPSALAPDAPVAASMPQLAAPAEEVNPQPDLGPPATVLPSSPLPPAPVAAEPVAAPVGEPAAPAQTLEVAPAPALAPSIAPSPPVAARPASPPRLRYVWVLQVGAYADESNALGALTAVLSLGLEAGAEPYDTQAGRLVRVRVGPFLRRDEADQAARRIKALKLPVLVLRQRP
jgi:cell division protein FtsN